MTSKRVIIESPLSGDHVRNLRYLLWCCRAVWLRDGLHAIASHLICPWFMDDGDPHEREAGMDWAWMWGTDVPHWHFLDLGYSQGMQQATVRCRAYQAQRMLADYHPESWAAFERGEWPPHTSGFEVAAHEPQSAGAS